MPFVCLQTLFDRQSACPNDCSMEIIQLIIVQWAIETVCISNCVWSLIISLIC